MKFYHIFAMLSAQLFLLKLLYNHYILGSNCRRLQLLPCMKELKVQATQTPTIVAGSLDTISSFSFLSQKRSSRSDFHRYCGNGTGFLMTVSSFKNKSDFDHNFQNQGNLDTSSLFHRHLRPHFHLMGQFATGYMQLTHVPMK